MFDEISKKKIESKLIFLTPEKITQSEVTNLLIKTLYMENKLERFVIDEVH